MDWFSYDNSLRHERVRWTSQPQRDEGTLDQKSNRAKDLKEVREKFESGTKIEK